MEGEREEWWKGKREKGRNERRERGKEGGRNGRRKGRREGERETTSSFSSLSLNVCLSELKRSRSHRKEVAPQKPRPSSVTQATRLLHESR